MQIELPDPIIKIERDWYEEDGIALDLTVGGVTVISRTYHTDYSKRDDRYVGDEEDARAKITAAFGDSLRTIFERNGLA